jgi:DNA-binding MarR family transcriptional regulator
MDKRKPQTAAPRLRSQKPPAPKQHRVFLASKDRSDAPPGAVDFVIGESIAHIVVVTARLFDRQLAMRLRRHDVPIGQWPFLLFLWANENLSQRDLSRLMAIEESTVTNTIDRMERDGLISRTRPPANRRRNQLRMTERGRGLLSTLVPEAMQVVRMAAHGMSKTEIAFLTTLLSKVQSNLADGRARPLGIEPRAEPDEATDAAPDTDSHHNTDRRSRIVVQVRAARRSQR